jgi:hypothetical protein
VKPTLKDLMNRPPDPCPLCGRPNHRPSDHHLVPKSRGGKVTETICRDCHDAIHATFDNRELEKEYATVDALMAHEGLAKMIRFIAKQDGRVRVRSTKKRRSR